MLLRGRSKDRSSRKVTPPGPSYMSNEQFGIKSSSLYLPHTPKHSSPLKTPIFQSTPLKTTETSDSHNQWTANYLAELRNGRINRPSGARPLPSSVTHDRRESLPGAPSMPSAEEGPARCETAQSHRRAQSAMSNFSASSRTGRALVQQPYPGLPERDASTERPVTLLKSSMVVPSATYIERGQRWMEKEEVVSLRDCLEDMDLQKQHQEEEARLHAAAQEEASELVWQHQNPGATRLDGPYRYKEHLRKHSYAHARTQSVGGVGTVTGLARDIPRSVSSGSINSSGTASQNRVASGSSGNIGGMLSQSRVSSGSSGVSKQVRVPTSNQSASDIPKEPAEAVVAKKVPKPYHGLTKTTGPLSRRRSSGKRNISGEPAGAFTGEQIWEEPEDAESVRGRPQDLGDMPAPLRLKPENPLNRVQFVQDPPTRSNIAPPEHTQKHSTIEIHQNPPSQSRNAAYTANPIPIPSAVQDRPEVPRKDGVEVRGDDIRQATSKSLRDRSAHLPTPAVVSDKPGRPIVSFDANWKPREADVKPVEERTRPRSDDRFGISKASKGLPPLPPTKDFRSTPLPTIHHSGPPAIQVNGAEPPSIPAITCSPTTVPTIVLPDTPRISVSGPATIPTITLDDTSTTKNASSRPLPHPKPSSTRPLPHKYSTDPGAMSRRHWSPAVGNRATATCHQCELPIEGRVVALKGLPQRFHPHCFICYTCGTGLEALEISPEPAEMRAARLSRIHCRAQGEPLEEIEDQTMADDGDERLRFYCHLDWHEHFAPRCKHCKTPIIGEHAVALGAHWHYGHFFCAECGDPFEQGMTHIEKDGYAWCLNCQTKRTQRQAPKCKKCRGPVIGQYVQALGGEYHDECFRCVTCRGGFDDGQIFPRMHGNETVAICTKCMERELKA